MHELTLVQGMLDSVNDSAAEKGRRVRSYRVGVGELAQFDGKLLRQLFADLTKGTALEGVSFSMEPEKSVLRCLGCGKTWEFQDVAGQLNKQEREMVHFLPEILNSCAKCPSCSKSFFDIEKGRSVRVIEVVFDG